MMKFLESVCECCGNPQALIALVGGRARWLCVLCALLEMNKLLGDWLGRYILTGYVVAPVMDPKLQVPLHEVPKPEDCFIPPKDPHTPYYLYAPLENAQEAGLWGLRLRVTDDPEAMHYNKQDLYIQFAAGVVEREEPPDTLALGVFPDEESAVRAAQRYGYSKPVGDGFYVHDEADEGPHWRLPILAYAYVKYIAPYAMEMIKSKDEQAILRLSADAHARGYRLCAVRAFVEEGFPPEACGGIDDH